MVKKIFLTIAGSDCSGGAGLQADLKTAWTLNHYGCSVVTSVTAQNTLFVSEIYPLADNIIKKQLTAIGEDFIPDSVKIGMICGDKAISAVHDFLKEYGIRNIVVDPVLSTTLGNKELCNPAEMKTMADLLFPIATLVTPNLDELNILEKTLGKRLSDICNAVLIKGGHSGESYCRDVLKTRTRKEDIEFVHKRIDTTNTHGSGCVLSSAIACYLNECTSIEEAVEKAVNFVNRQFVANIEIKIGKGTYGPTIY